MGIEFGLLADNSSGKQRLLFTRNIENKSLDVTLLGKYDDSDIQIDFDSLCIEDVEDLIYFLDHNLKKMINLQKG
jgi:hypothetical protein